MRSLLVNMFLSSLVNVLKFVVFQAFCIFALAIPGASAQQPSQCLFNFNCLPSSKKHFSKVTIPRSSLMAFLVFQNL